MVKISITFFVCVDLKCADIFFGQYKKNYLKKIFKKNQTNVSEKCAKIVIYKGRPP